ncbi:hypothetical protein Avbf_17929 [Armadillidium vulgare]|nr:hypothetical protein Avbf_17929 [Armadillidium vulgare]
MITQHQQNHSGFTSHQQQPLQLLPLQQLQLHLHPLLPQINLICHHNQ